MPRGGYRPNSGRKTLDEEQKRLRSIFRCFDVVMEFVNSDAPLKERAEMAAKIAVKIVPQTVDMSIINGNGDDKSFRDHFFGIKTSPAGQEPQTDDGEDY